VTDLETDFSWYEEMKAPYRGNGIAPPELPLPEIHRADVARWRGREPPDIPFTVEDLMPGGMVTLLTSHGGAGKTLLLQMAGTVIAAATLDYLGKRALAGRAAGVFGEDPEAVLHVRQPRINHHFKIDYDRIEGRYFPQSYFGMRAQLWRNGAVTPFFRQLEDNLAQIDALRLVTLDNAAVLFSGDENSRPEVTEFLSELNGLADRLDIGILLSAHASKSQDGTPLRVTSGSTAWVNACRSVLELKAGDEQSGPTLTVVKANHAATGTEIPLRWEDKLLVADQRMPARLPLFERSACELWFLDQLDKTIKSGRFVSHSKNAAASYAPKVFYDQQSARGASRYSKKHLEEAMQRLFDDGAIVVQQVGRPGREHSEIARTEAVVTHV